MNDKARNMTPEEAKAVEAAYLRSPEHKALLARREALEWAFRQRSGGSSSNPGKEYVK